MTIEDFEKFIAKRDEHRLSQASTMRVAVADAMRRSWARPLATVGMPELVAETADEYVTRATALAQDLPRLATLRGTLRDRVRTSPLVDAVRFAAAVEQAYVAMAERAVAEGAQP